MRRKWLSISLAGAVSLSLLAGCSGKGKDTMAPVDPGTTAVTVKVEEVKEGEVNEPIRLLAEVSANANVAIVPKVSGTLREIYVKKGDAVKNGQVLAKLDQTDYILGVRQAEAALEMANASLKQAREGNGAAESGHSSYEIAKRGLEIAQANYDRTKALFEAGAASQSQLEQAEAALHQAQSQLNQAKQGMAAIEVAEAGVRQAQVGLERANSSLNDTVIRATADGIVSSIHYDTGALVGPQGPVFTLIDLDPVLVKLNVSENNLAKFKTGMEVDLNVPAQSAAVKGKVKYVGLQADAQSKMFPVEIEVANPDRRLVPGMKAEVLAKDPESKKGLLLPTDAIMEQDGKKYVYVTEGDKAVKREVTVSEGNSSKVVVLQGVNAGDKVVVKGQSNLRDQAKIRLEE